MASVMHRLKYALWNFPGRLGSHRLLLIWSAPPVFFCGGASSGRRANYRLIASSSVVIHPFRCSHRTLSSLQPFNASEHFATRLAIGKTDLPGFRRPYCLSCKPAASAAVHAEPGAIAILGPALDSTLANFRQDLWICNWKIDSRHLAQAFLSLGSHVFSGGSPERLVYDAFRMAMRGLRPLSFLPVEE